MKQKRYYVELPVEPYGALYDERRKWLKENFGNCWQDGKLRHSVSNYNGTRMSRYIFVNESDAVMFALRWSGTSNA